MLSCLTEDVLRKTGNGRGQAREMFRWAEVFAAKPDN